MEATSHPSADSPPSPVQLLAPEEGALALAQDMADLGRVAQGFGWLSLQEWACPLPWPLLALPQPLIPPLITAFSVFGCKGRHRYSELLKNPQAFCGGPVILV